MGITRLLIDCGEALYGPLWQSALARDLGVSARTMRRWVAGGDPPVGIYLELMRITQERALALDALATRLKSSAEPSRAAAHRSKR